MLGALDLALVFPHVAFGERVVGVRALVADRVEVVADAHERDAVAVDVEASGRTRREIVDDATRNVSAHYRRTRRCSSLSMTVPRNRCVSALTGRRANTSSKNPSTIRRSASAGGTPRDSR